MKEAPKKVGVLALRRLIVELMEHRPDICIRYRLIGRMWAENFLRVIRLTDQGVLLNDETSNKAVTISDLSHIMQFEIDKPFQLYQPYFHYEVVITGEW
jgi:hypothetical protein